MSPLPTMHAPLRRALTSAAALLVCACQHPSIGVGPRRADVFSPMEQSPLLMELGPPVEPAEPATPVRRPIGGPELVSLDFRHSSLAEVVNLIATQAHANILLDAGLDRPVDVSFPSVTLDDALTILLQRNGLRLAEGPGGVYWVERADGSEPALAEFHLKSIHADDVAENLKALVGGESKIVVDRQHNYVLVRGTRGDVAAVETYLAGVDRLKQQVLVEVHLFEVRLDDGFEFGINAAFDGDVNGNALTIAQGLAGAADDFSLMFSSEDLEATVRALRRYVGLDLLSSPRVMAVSSTEAKIEVVEEIPYVETTAVTSGTTGGVGSTVQESVQFKEAGIRLAVTPTIQEDGVLQLAIHQELSEVIDYFNDIPVIDARTLDSQFLVGDRHTVVLGGLMQDRHSEADRGIPLLMHIPFVGRLFKSDADDVLKRELLIFVTCRILDPTQASRLTPGFQDRFRDRRSVLAPPVLGSGNDRQD